METDFSDAVLYINNAISWKSKIESYYYHSYIQFLSSGWPAIFFEKKKSTYSKFLWILQVYFILFSSNVDKTYCVKHRKTTTWEAVNSQNNQTNQSFLQDSLTQVYISQTWPKIYFTGLH